MEHVTLGRSGLHVSRACLGAMMFGHTNTPTSEDESRRIIDAFLDTGANFIDTANVYNGGQSEEVVGRAIAPSASRSCWRPRAAVRSATARTSRAWAASTSPVRSRRACAGSAPTTSTCTSATAPIPTRPSKRRWRRSTGSCSRARCATSAARTGPARRWSRPSGPRRRWAARRSSACNRATRSTPARSRTTSCRPRSATASAR